MSQAFNGVIKREINIRLYKLICSVLMKLGAIS
jgi:hypothetical protein